MMLDSNSLNYLSSKACEFMESKLLVVETSNSSWALSSSQACFRAVFGAHDSTMICEIEGSIAGILCMSLNQEQSTHSSEAME